MDNSKIKVGIIGFGRMGGKYLDKFLKNGRYDVAYICDVNKEARDSAAKLSPSSTIVADEQIVFEDPKVQVVALCTLANFRKEQIDKAVRYGKHIISEKPVADTVEREWDVVRTTENSNVLSTVNLYLRNSWYHETMKRFIDEGELGELAIIRVCHMTPGLAPGEGHEYEGPCFHDCGMHYVDIARWYAAMFPVPKILSMSNPSLSPISAKGHALLLGSLIQFFSFRFWDKKRPQLLP